MTRFTRALVAALGVVLLGFVMTLIPQKNASGSPNGAPVTVENVPLPVNLTNTPLPVSGNVNASQSGAWSVGVNNFPTTQSISFSGVQPVSLTNTASAPLFIRDVDNGRNPFQQRLQLDNGFADPTTFPGSSCSNVAACQTTFNVPPGMRLVIEHIGARVQGTQGQQYTVQLISNAPGGISVWLVLNLQATFGGFPAPLSPTNDIFTASQQMRVYVDSNASPPPTVVVDSNIGQRYFADINISGYLIPAS